MRRKANRLSVGLKLTYKQGVSPLTAFGGLLQSQNWQNKLITTIIIMKIITKIMMMMMIIIEVLWPVSQCFGHPYPPSDRGLVVWLSTMLPGGPTMTITVCDGQKTQGDTCRTRPA